MISRSTSKFATGSTQSLDREDVVGGPEARALLNIISGEIELAKAATSKHAPDDARAREATCRSWRRSRITYSPRTRG